MFKTLAFDVLGGLLSAFIGSIFFSIIDYRTLYKDDDWHLGYTMFFPPRKSKSVIAAYEESE